jgi:hypothetical protein
MKAPFPWFGGKRRVAPEIWRAFGDVDNYVEPFAGSLAVLLERPDHCGKWQTGAETVNDRDAYVANFWRAIVADPDAVAQHADWPVNETELFARHLWLVTTGRERVANLEADPDYFDAKVAGWWLWGLCAWIGSGWCSGRGPWSNDEASQGVKRKLPHLGDAGRGVHRQLPHLGDAGQGVHRQLPHLGDAGRGVVHSAGDMTAGGSWDRSEWLDGEPLVYCYLRALRTRLRRVRVCCGDWFRVVTDGALSYGGTVGVLLDPPYSTDERTAGLYRDDHDTVNLSAAVRQWAIDHGDDPRLRIALCGYEGEHDMPGDWRTHEWKSSGAYIGGNGGATNAINRHRERIWFSPACCHGARQVTLW